MRLRVSVSRLFQFRSFFLNPQVSFIVMQVSQSTPGIPVAGDAAVRGAEIARVLLSAEPLNALAAHADRLLIINRGFRVPQ